MRYWLHVLQAEIIDTKGNLIYITPPVDFDQPARIADHCMLHSSVCFAASALHLPR